MAKYYYPAIFERDEEAKTYTVTFPDLQGCITQGENLEDASEMAKEAVGVYFDGIREKDFPAPVKTSIFIALTLAAANISLHLSPITTHCFKSKLCLSAAFSNNSIPGFLHLQP